mgnify:CR=1 FL=1
MQFGLIEILIAVISAFITGALVPLWIQRRHWQREERNQSKALRSQLEAVRDEISQNYNRLQQMLGELKGGIAPSYFLSTVNRNAVWQDILKTEKLSADPNLVQSLNDLYYEFEHINYKVRFIREIFSAVPKDFLDRAIAGAIALIERNLQNSSLKEKCCRGIQEIIDSLLPSKRTKRVLIEKKRFVMGAAISALGALIIISVNFVWPNNIYDALFFKPLMQGLHDLTDFKPEPSEADGRQRIKTLERGSAEFEAIRRILIANVETIRSLNIEKITNRRQAKYEEQSKQYLDLMNVIHVYDSNTHPNYNLATTESDLRTWITLYRSRWIELIGTIFVIAGIFLPYLWQGFRFVVEE